MPPQVEDRANDVLEGHEGSLAGSGHVCTPLPVSAAAGLVTMSWNIRIPTLC